jgi:hypothetical protein
LRPHHTIFTTHTTHTFLTIHAPGRRLVLRLPPSHCVIAPRPELEKVWLFGRRLLRSALDLRCAAVAGCAPLYRVVAPRPEPERAWLSGRRGRPLSAPASPQAPYRSLLGLAIMASLLRHRPCPAHCLAAFGLALPTRLAPPSTYLRRQNSPSGLTPSSTATHSRPRRSPRHPDRPQHAAAVGHI